MAIITITGHRPNKLFGYDLMDSRYAQLRTLIKQKLLEYGCQELYTGMALGVDQLAALAVLDLQDQGHAIKLHAAIPCQGHPSKWPKASQDLYRAILSKCDSVDLVTDAPYSARLMQRRNEYMVDRSDLVLAVWDGTTGGTCNCVQYALRHKKPVWHIHPGFHAKDGWAGNTAWAG